MRNIIIGISFVFLLHGTQAIGSDEVKVFSPPNSLSAAEVDVDPFSRSNSLIKPEPYYGEEYDHTENHRQGDLPGGITDSDFSFSDGEVGSIKIKPLNVESRSTPKTTNDDSACISCAIL